MKFYTRNNHGVTMIELIIVVAIIGVISTIGIPNFIGILRNNRLKSGAMNLLTAVRETRSKALADGRRFKFTVDTTNFLYTRERLVFRQIDVLRLPLEEYLYEETTTELAEINNHPTNKNVSFNYRGGILSMTTVPSSGFELSFNPSGTIDIPGTGFASINMYGPYYGYQVKIYKGGQINLQQIRLP